MMIGRLTISFTPSESQVLQAMAEKDFRPPKDHVRWLLREEAKRRGLWPPVKAPQESQRATEEGV